MSESLKVGVIQISSTLDYQINLAKINDFMKEAVSKGAQAIFLPECFYSLSDGKNPSPYLVDKGNEHYENIKKLAVEHEVYLIGGSVSYNGGDGKILNRVINFDPQGNEIGIYDKINLFSCDIVKDGKRKKVNEADIFTPGSQTCIVDVEGFKIGIAVCFDLRFSSLLQDYFHKTDIITFASAFTVPSGMAHWHVLNKSRAIEGQCFVISAAQVGQNHPNVRTYGHSLIVNPWGEVICDLKDDEGVCVHELLKSDISDVRAKIIMS